VLSSFTIYLFSILHFPLVFFFSLACLSTMDGTRILGIRGKIKKIKFLGGTKLSLEGLSHIYIYIYII